MIEMKNETLAKERDSRIAAGETSSASVVRGHGGVWVYRRIGQDVYITSPAGTVQKEAV